MGIRRSSALVLACLVFGGGIDVPGADAGTGKTWAFLPLRTDVPPAVGHPAGIGNGIDGFIERSLQAAGLQPGPPADRRSLIRRATFDLTGLPPSPAEVEAFTQDASPGAFARLIDRLLASPHYGEQWARHWLDVARYSDTKGYVYAREEKRWVHAWAYRDWVARALNDDMPYDRFVKLQVAADQLVPAGSPDLAAMGFLTLGRRFLGVTHDIIDDRIDVVTRGLLGLTVACARCHDHKYDPIPTRDYYSLYGVFQSSAEKLVPCGASRDPGFLLELRKREQKLSGTLAQRREEQSARVRARVKDHLLAQLELDKYPEETFGIILEANDLNPFVVRRWQAYLAKDGQSSEPAFAEWHRLRGEGDPGKLRDCAARYGERFADVEKRWREALRTDPKTSVMTDPGDERLRRVLYGIESPCHVPDEHIANIEMYFPTPVVVELWKLQGEVDRWLLDSPQAPPQATILVDRPLPSEPRVFVRGNPLNKGDVVPRRFLEAIAGREAGTFSRGSGRLELANAIADPRNPLTARVMVNRVWQHHFGRGLVETPSDFGKRAGLPSHPELLDWLARRFIESGWSLKQLHRTIMLARTYQQSSLPRADGADPDNRLLGRMRAHRLSFEEARDAWLTASGEIDLRVGGKGEALFAGKNTRRTVYAQVDREQLPAVLRTFDFANPDLSIPQRNETTVPQQALFGLNHPFVVARAAALVRRLPAGDAKTRVKDLYARLYQREPAAEEMAGALALVQSGAPAPAPSEGPGAWRYGFGEFDVESGRLKNFTALPYFSGTAWQGGGDFPDAKLGWVQLTAAGGHPGNDRKHAAVRRWTAPEDGSYQLRSRLIHEPEAGAGIRAFVSHSARGLLRSEELHHSSAAVDLESIEMRKGETLDFVVDLRAGLNSNQFLWAPRISHLGAAGSGGDLAGRAWSAEENFSGGGVARLDPWQQVAQVLMLANEFMFVD